MKKALTGCLVVVLLAVVVGGAAGYWFIIRPAWQAGSAVVDAARQWQQVAEIEKQVRNTERYRGPDDGRLDPAQVRRFVAVQGEIFDALGEDWKALEARYEQQRLAQRESGEEPSLAERFGALNDLSNVVVRAKQAQVQALNRAGWSLAEYRWVRAHAYQAVGLAMADKTPQPLADSALAHNADLLRPHRELLKKTLATTWLGF